MKDFKLKMIVTDLEDNELGEISADSRQMELMTELHGLDPLALMLSTVLDEIETLSKDKTT